LLLKELEEEVTYLYHPDHLGSVSVVSNQKGLPYERVEYLPFGEVWIEETDPATGYIPFRFTSKELDEETGLYYYGARYYEPTISRWMSADPAGFALSNPNRSGYSIIEAANWYAYVSNNPVIYVDPTGMEGTSARNFKDFDYIHKFVGVQEGGQWLKGYVPNNNGVAIGRSGVTIGSGFDIGQHNAYDLDRIFGKGTQNQDLKDKYSEYLGKTKQDAIDYLAENPLEITKEQADRTDNLVFGNKLGKLEDRYNRLYNNSKATGDSSFARLPKEARAVLMSLSYHFGSAPKDVTDAISKGDYTGAAEILTKMGEEKYTGRRELEANELGKIDTD